MVTDDYNNNNETKLNETKLYFTHYHNIKSMIKIKFKKIVYGALN